MAYFIYYFYTCIVNTNENNTPFMNRAVEMHRKWVKMIKDSDEEDDSLDDD